MASDAGKSRLWGDSEEIAAIEPSVFGCNRVEKYKYFIDLASVEGHTPRVSCLAIARKADS